MTAVAVTGIFIAGMATMLLIEGVADWYIRRRAGGL